MGGPFFFYFEFIFSIPDNQYSDVNSATIPISIGIVALLFHSN